jgi:cytochrome P450
MGAAADQVNRCPATGAGPFEPLSIEAARDPHPWLRLARRDAPVFFSDAVEAWFVTRYEDVVDVLRRPDVFSSVGANTFKPLVSPVLARVYREGPPSRHSMVRKDPPEHTRIRKLAQKAYSPRLIDAMEPRIKRHCERLVDTFVDTGRCEFMGDYAEQVSLRVIVDITGAPMEYADDFIQWGRDMFSLNVAGPHLTAERAEVIAARAERIMAWMLPFVEERRSRPCDDFVSSLVHATSDDGEPTLTTDEVVGILNANLVAGIETTANLMTLLVRQLLAAPGLWHQVPSDEQALKAAVEEALRFWAPARAALRVTTADVSVGGVQIPRGARVVVSFASANRDEAIFGDGESFDGARANAAKHLSFGRFTHMCLGAPIARLETRVAIETFARRLPQARLAPSAAEGWIPHLLVPGLEALAIEW